MARRAALRRLTVVLDHLVVGAVTLDQGVAWLRQRLGVTLPVGGKHPLMGTHNHLTRIGPSVFLEIIAIDPDAPAPGRARWFGLDDPEQQARLAERPRPIAWVAGIRDWAQVDQAAFDGTGPPLPVTRGALSWELTVPENGSLPEGGVLPALIRWRDGPHPAEAMADLGLRIERLEGRHPEPERIRKLLVRLAAENLVDLLPGETAGISADIRRPNGQVVTLD